MNFITEMIKIENSVLFLKTFQRNSIIPGEHTTNTLARNSSPLKLTWKAKLIFFFLFGLKLAEQEPESLEGPKMVRF